MCGIAGFCDFRKRADESALREMTNTLAHRGPNDSGYDLFRENNSNVGLGHKRLSILDLSIKGHKPMHFDNSTIIFNGEIYNFQTIRKELEQIGYKFDSNSDTEVILKGYHCWKTKIIDKLIGMFAIAIYDQSKHELILIRDRAGVKPLYYYWKDNILLFASELKSFYTQSSFVKAIDHNSLALFLQYSYIPAPYTIFKNTWKLKPGHLIRLNVDSSDIKEEEYWSVANVYNQPKQHISEDEAIRQTEEMMQSAYKYRMVSDVPVGVFLSGGYDSASVAALLQKDRTEKIKTFTIGYHESAFNEAKEASAIATYLGTDHHEWYVTANDAAGIMESLPEIYDEPFADNSTVPTILVSQLAKKNVKVALSADGGDEIFGGYNKFNQSLRYTRLFPAWVQRILGSSMNIVSPNRIPLLNQKYNFSTRYEKMKMIWSAADPIEAMKYISQYITHSETELFLKATFDTYDTKFDTGYEVNNANDDINRMLAIDYQTFLPDNNLVKVDRATMSVGLEGREPMLDHRLIELVSSFPSDLKIKNGVNKYLLKQIVHRHIPPNLMDRPKRPFIAPLTIWFKESLREKITEYLNENTLSKQGIFNVSSVLDFRDRYLNGEKVNYQKLWHILVFQLWYQRWM